MKYLLDTNICIYIINNRPSHVIKRAQSNKPSDIALSVITLSELQKGVSKSANIKKNQSALNDFISIFQILPYEKSEAIVYGEIVSKLEKRGGIIGANDLFIAAHGLSRNLTLVTNNEKEFKRVDGLKIENWAKE